MAFDLEKSEFAEKKVQTEERMKAEDIKHRKEREEARTKFQAEKEAYETQKVRIQRATGLWVTRIR